ncbi:phenol hydroxylase subunit [Paralysiella testudinis]|uniref:Phenol hydroxylase n=1 Tax=Paralysiella testudinis TaxID=2809020 RepID=A0A892ZIF4_9NEIS|nr:phenol hydroxylase subunit [Paralysiella testudinis]QRQ82712.1 hypothetical protein JQU52_04815 [Paralysiella testudinis]
MSVTAYTPAGAALPALTKFVRVRSTADARFVAFDFAIGDPALFVELVMPPAAFADFCARNQVVHMSEAQMAAVDSELEKWRYGEDTLMCHNHQRNTQANSD